MTATIIETNDSPLKKVEVEGVTADIIENALKNARIEMDAVLFRTDGRRYEGIMGTNEPAVVRQHLDAFCEPWDESDYRQDQRMVEQI